MKNRVLHIILITLISFTGIAQNVKFTTQVSARKVGVSDRFQVTYSSNKRGSFITPKFKHFKQLSAVGTGSSSNVNLNTGETKVTYTYTIVLQPKDIGTFKVEGAKIKIGNATYESKPVSVEVVKESQARQRRSQDPFDMMRQMQKEMDDMMRGFPRTQRQPVEITDKDFFARISVSKNKVKKGEGLLLSYKIYARNFNFGLEKYDFPTQQNFWSENIKIPENIKPTSEIIKGIQYQVYTLKKEYVFPQKSGELTLNPFGITARIQTSPFSPAISKELKSNSPIITVESLPKNAPLSFVNQVGNYKLNVGLANDSLQINEPIDFTIQISGKGNLKQMNEISLEFPEAFEVYDPEVKNNISVSESGVKGKKKFNYLLIPRKSGSFVIPEVEFTYFDLETNSYKTISSPTRKVIVTNPDGVLEETTSDKDFTDNNQSKGNTVSLNLSYIWYVLGFLGIIGLVYLLFMFITKRKNKEETEEDRRKNARKKLAKKLAKAKSHLDTQNVSEFYNEILIGLNKYINEKLGIETAEMTKRTIRESLIEKGVEDSTINSFIGVLEKCEMAKYAPLSPQNNDIIYEKSIDVIEEIENQMR